jgi:hypothetical protein
MSNKLFCTGAAVVCFAACLSLSAGYARADFMWADTNQDGVVNSFDIDAIYQNLTVAPSTYMGIWPRPLAAYQAQYDVNGDGVVSQADVTYELQQGFKTTYGDFNLDGHVDFNDYIDLLDHMNQSGGWAQGDINGDGVINYKDWYSLYGVHPGDANQDGAVDFQDFQILLNHWQDSGRSLGVAQGDFNLDGVVDFLDFQILLNYWNPSGVWNGASGGFEPMQAPEPASLSLLALGGLALLRRKK